MSIYATLARFIRDSTAAGRALLTAATASDQRTALGLGSAAQSASSDFAAAIHTHDDRYFTEAEIASLLTSYLTVSVAGTTYQPLDSDLTAIAALSTTSFGRSLLTQADAAATRTTIGAGTSSFDGAFASLSGIPSTFTPASHVHGNITNAGAIGVTANLPLITSASGVITVGAFGTTANTFCQGDDSRLSDARTPTAHNQAWSTITSTPTTLAGYGITDAITSAAVAAGYQPLDSDLTAIAALSTTTFGRSLLTQADAAAARTTIGAGTSSFDGAYSSLSGIPSTFTPASHVHGNITNAGAIGSTANLPLITTTSGVITVGSFGTAASTFCEGNDSRLSDARTPTAHNQAWSTITSTPTTLAGYGITDAITSAAVAAGYQPLDSDLTAIAALSTTTFGRSLLTQADAATTRTTLGLGTLATQSGTFSGTSSGTNTGDQTITLTGDVTGSGTGTFSVTIGAGKVTNDMLAGSISASKLAITGTPDGTKYLRDDFSWQTISLAGYALTSGTLAQFASTSSSQFAGVISDETGSGLVVFNNNPALISPTMDSVTLTERLGNEMVVDGAFTGSAQFTCAVAGVNITNDTMTLSSDPGWVVNDVVQYFNGGGASAGGLVHRGFYFIESNSAGVIGVKTTTAGAKVNLTSTGNNAQFFIKTNWFAGTSGTTGGVDGWDLSAGTASHQVAGTPTLRPAVALAPTVGQLYKIQYTVSNWTVAGCSITFGGVLAQATTAPTANGTRTLYVTAQTTGDLSIVPVTGMRADLDNFSIRPVLSGVATSAIPMVFNETLSDAIANEVAYAFHYTVNKSNQGNNTGLQINMNDVSSPGTSNCLQVTVNGTSFFTVNNAGNVSMAGLTSTSISCTSVTASGAVSAATGFSSAYAGAASTPVIRTSGALFTGGTGTTTFPQILQQPTAATAVTTWSTAGTFWGANGPTGFTGNFIDHHVNGGASVFIVDSTGRVTAAGGVVTGTLINTGTLTLPTSTDTLIGRATTDTLTNKNLTPRVDSQTSSATPSPNFATHDQYNLTSLAVDATFAAPAGTLTDGMRRLIRIKDNGTARLLAWNSVYRAIGVTLPTTTVIGKTIYIGLVYNAADVRWDVLAVGVQA